MKKKNKKMNKWEASGLLDGLTRIQLGLSKLFEPKMKQKVPKK